MSRSITMRQPRRAAGARTAARAPAHVCSCAQTDRQTVDPCTAPITTNQGVVDRTGAVPPAGVRVLLYSPVQLYMRQTRMAACREFMFISHESDHCQTKKLVVSPAINQVLHSLLVRLLRARRLLCVSHYLLTSLHDPQTSAAVAIVLL